MTKKEMVNFWEKNGMVFLNENIKEGHIKFNTEEELKNIINSWLEIYAPNVERL
jgi:hypothetical protein